MNVMQLKAFADQHNPWRCRAWGGVAQNVNNGSFSWPAMTVIDFDPSGMVTTGTTAAAAKAVVTIPVDGIYYVGVSGCIAALPDGGRMVVSIFKNGAEVKRGMDWLSGGAAAMTGQCNAILYLKAGDTLAMGQFTATAAMSTVIGSPLLFISVAYLCAA